ncbi:MAG: signal recognition particle receptor subunit alpha, partial [Gaiellaceae bacterium]
MSRTWADLLGEEGAAQESEAERAGFFGRLRDSLGKSRRALTEQLAAAAFDPADDEAWERLEEALIAADVGVPATAELVRRLEA